MIVIHVDVQTSQPDTFEPLLRDICADALAMDGCTVYEWYRDPDNTARYVIYGEFESHDVFAAYHASPVVARIGTDLMPLLDGPPVFKHLDAAVMDG